MKIKIYKYPFIAIAMLVTVLSCSDEFLEVDPSGQFLSGNYYANQGEAFAGLVAAYDYMRKNSGGFENMVTMMNAGSDDHYAGGGGPSDGAGIQSFSNYSLNANEIPGSFWSDFYRGIFRANIMILKIPDVPMDESLKTRYTAECKALRAYYHFKLVSLFKNVPLFTEPVNPAEMYNVLQASPEEVYAQIEADLLAAIPNLPEILDATELGRFSKVRLKRCLEKYIWSSIKIHWQQHNLLQ